MVAFQFFNMFVSSVFWYVFNDVVPTAFLGRFAGAFRVVGGVAGSLYSYFIFGYAETNMREIFVGAALLYFIGIGTMCLMVKEGEYPPVNAEEEKAASGLAGVKLFLKECFSHRFYWTKFLFSAFVAAGTVVGPFNIFYLKDMGLTVGDIGKAGGIVGIASVAAMYFAAVFVDRWHPLRITVYASVFACVSSIGGWVWLFVTLPPQNFFWLHMMGSSLLSIFLGTLVGAASFPLEMRLAPKSRFGQFCSAQALLRSFATMLAGLAIGLFFDALRAICGNTDFIYRFNFVWNSVLNNLSRPGNTMA